MHHVAIMNKQWRLIPKILRGEKTIESRWYRTKRSPWNRIKNGDVIFFKNSGEPVIARAVAKDVTQLEIKGLSDARDIVRRYGKEICLVNDDPATWGSLPRYCILITLQSPQKIDQPFHIDKTGFGSGVAWINVQDIETITT